MVYYTEKPALRLTKIYTSVKIYEKLLLSMPVKVGFGSHCFLLVFENS